MGDSAAQMADSLTKDFNVYLRAGRKLRMLRTGWRV